jgi:dTMP kinase
VPGRPLFIALEGGEGSGKSTLAIALGTQLEAAGLDVLLTREPGGTLPGEQVRAVLRDRLTPWGETFAFLLARAELAERVIAPALARGRVVICDRFEASTLAYQGYGRGLPIAALRTVNAFATNGLRPDLTLFLDLDPAVGLARKHGEREAIQTGTEHLAFHRRVREGYLALAAEEPERWVRLDATLDQGSLARCALETVVAKFPLA